MKHPASETDIFNKRKWFKTNDWVYIVINASHKVNAFLRICKITCFDIFNHAPSLTVEELKMTYSYIITEKTKIDNDGVLQNIHDCI